MKTKLSQLHRRLNQIRKLRRSAKLAIGLCGLAVAVLWLLFGMFLADWQFRMGRPERIVLMVIAAGMAVWAFRRLTSPWLGHGEDELDMALLVERQQHIDSDMVAALEFEWPDAPRWGSVQLEQAVIEQTAAVAPTLDIKADIPTEQLRRRLTGLAITVAVLGALIVMFPQYAKTFFNRLALGALRYPTGTSIEWLTINGREVSLSWAGQEVKSPYGQPVKFEMKASGELPESGSVRMTSENGMKTTVALAPESVGADVYRGELSRLVDSADCQVHLGDAWTELIKLVLVPPPTVDVEMEVTPPGYAGSSTEPYKDLRQISVIEGSQVVVRIVSDKELKEATLSIDNDSHLMIREGNAPKAGDKDSWVLGSAGSPMARVTEPIRFVIQVTDVDGLQLERPIEGVVRIKVDHPPQVAATIETKFVLPTAKPRLAFSASDDYGLARLAVIPEVIHADGKEEKRPEIVLFEVKDDETSPTELENEKDFRLQLESLAASKGEQIRLTVRAVDFRGQKQEGKSALSEPLILQVTDLKGIMEAQTESLREAERQVKTMTDLQIGVGEAK